MSEMIMMATKRLLEAGAAGSELLAVLSAQRGAAQPRPVDALGFAQALLWHRGEFRVKPRC